MTFNDNAIVSAGFGAKRYVESHNRLVRICSENGILTFGPRTQAELDVLRQQQMVGVPYAFKPQLVYQCSRTHHDIRRILWCDSVIVPDAEKMQAVWDKIDEVGVMLMGDPPWTVGQWSTDKCLDVMGVSRDRAFSWTSIAACVMGFDMQNPMAIDFINRWYEAALDGAALCGPHTNTAAIPLLKKRGLICDVRRSGFCSKNPEVYGHRHDQTVAAIIAHQMGIPLTPWDGILSYDRNKPAALTSDGLNV